MVTAAEMLKIIPAHVLSQLSPTMPLDQILAILAKYNITIPDDGGDSTGGGGGGVTGLASAYTTGGVCLLIKEMGVTATTSVAPYEDVWKKLTAGHTNAPLDIVVHMCAFVASVEDWITPIAVITIILGVIGLLLNSAIFIQYFRQPRRSRNRQTHTLVFHQAVVDFFNCAFNCNITGAGWFSFNQFSKEALRVFRFYCVTVGFNSVSVLSSLLNFALIVIVVFLAVHKPDTAAKIGRFPLFIGFVSVWLISIAIASALSSIFYRVFNEGMESVHLENAFLAMTVIFLFVFLFVGVMYLVTVCKKRRAKPPAKPLADETDLLLFCLFFVSFVFGLIIYAVSFIYYDVYILSGDLAVDVKEYNEIFYKLMGISTAFFTVNSILNPILTMWRVKQFRLWRRNVEPEQAPAELGVMHQDNGCIVEEVT